MGKTCEWPSEWKVMSSYPRPAKLETLSKTRNLQLLRCINVELEVTLEKGVLPKALNVNKEHY